MGLPVIHGFGTGTRNNLLQLLLRGWALNLGFCHFAYAASGSSVTHPSTDDDVYPPPSASTLDSDDSVILLLGAVVILVFAAGFLSQLYSRWITAIFQKRRRYQNIDDDNSWGLFHTEQGSHRMADLEPGDPIPSDVNSSPSNPKVLNNSYIACHGHLNEHAVEINGIKKVVLILGSSHNRAQDAYTEWLETWRRRHRSQSNSRVNEPLTEQ